MAGAPALTIDDPVAFHEFNNSLTATFGTDATVPTGTEQYAAGPTGDANDAFDFNGSTRVHAPTAAARITGDVSFSMWVYNERNHTSWQTLLTVEGGAETEATNILYSLYLTSTNSYLSFYSESGAGVDADLTTTEAVALNTWTHLAVRRVSNVVSIWKDGVKVDEATLTAPTGGSSSNVNLGANASNGSTFDGRIADVKIFDSALTNDEMASLYTGSLVSRRTRIHGLKSDGFVFGQKVDLVTAKAEGSSFRVKFVNPKEGAALFGRRPSAVTYLTSDETNTATTIRCAGAGAFPTSGRAYVNTETFEYTATSTAGFLGCVRGDWESLAQYHYTADGERQRYPEITDHPVVLEGRRVRFYAYAPGDDKQGDGTLVWVGIASTDANFNGIVWSFQVDSMFRVLDQDVGGDLKDPTPIRGIYYPESGPLVLRFYEANSTAAPPSGSVTTEGAIAIAGFWETNAAFVAALNTAIDAELTARSFNQTDFRAVEDGDSWAIEFTADLSTPRYMFCESWSPTDQLGQIDNGSSGRLVGVVTAGSTYQIRQDDAYPSAGTVPRACWGGYIHSREQAASLAESQKTGMDGTHYSWRIYMGGSTAVTSNTTAMSVDVTPPDVPQLSNAFSGVFNASVSAIDASDRYIDINRPADLRPRAAGDDDRDPVASAFTACVASSLPEVRLGRDYGVGGLSDFFIDTTTGIMAQCAQWVNTGAVPNVHPTTSILGDVVLDTSGNELQLAAASNRFTAARYYSVFTEVSLRELVEHECRLLGTFPVIDNGQYITFKRLRLPSQSEGKSTPVTASLVLTDDQVLSWERAALGIYNTVRVRTGYDPIEDEHKGSVYKIRDVAAFGQSPNSRTLDIQPKSGDPGTVRYEDVVAIGSRVLGVFGGPYVYLDVDVPLTMWGTEPGDILSITWSKLPNTDGTLGVTGKLGLVTAVEFEPMKARGKLTVLLTDQRIAGYAPAGQVTVVSNGTSGTTGPFTVALSSDDFPSGTTAADFFEAGDLVRVYRLDSNSTATVLGSVDSVASNSVTWTADSNWTYSTHTWALGFQVATSITADGQKVFASVSQTDGLVDYSGDTNNPPFTLAP